MPLTIRQRLLFFHIQEIALPPPLGEVPQIKDLERRVFVSCLSVTCGDSSPGG